MVNIYLIRDLCKTHYFVLLNVVKDLYIAEIHNVRILHYVQKDSLKRFCKGLNSIFMQQICRIY